MNLTKRIVFLCIIFISGCVCYTSAKPLPADSIQKNKTAKIKKKKQAITKAQDFNTTRSNRENRFATNNPNVNDSTSANQPRKITQAQDFNTTRSNRENRFATNNPNVNDSTSANQPSKITQAQDFNTTRSNRENRFATNNPNTTNHFPYFEIAISPLASFPLARDKQHQFQGYSLGNEIEIHYFPSKVGFSLSGGFDIVTTDESAVKKQMQTLGFESGYATETYSGTESFVLAGAAIRMGNTIRYTGELQAGLQINQPLEVTVTAKDGSTRLLAVQNSGEIIHPVVKAGFSVGFPLSNSWALDLGTDYRFSQTSIRYTDYSKDLPEDIKLNVHQIAISLKLSYQIPYCDGF